VSRCLVHCHVGQKNLGALRRLVDRCRVKLVKLQVDTLRAPFQGEGDGAGRWQRPEPQSLLLFTVASTPPTRVDNRTLRASIVRPGSLLGCSP
jgi:hypothetical protein